MTIEDIVFCKFDGCAETRWTFGDCFENKDECLSERYALQNLTEIAGVKLDNLIQGSLDFALLMSLSLPEVPSMNCEELCNCLSCGYGECTNDDSQDHCPNGNFGFICKCSSSLQYPRFIDILRDMVITKMACRVCSK